MKLSELHSHLRVSHLPLSFVRNMLTVPDRGRLHIQPSLASLDIVILCLRTPSKGNHSLRSHAQHLNYLSPFPLDNNPSSYTLFPSPASNLHHPSMNILVFITFISGLSLQLQRVGFLLTAKFSQFYLTRYSPGD
jgi:hypothetical protein